MIQIYWYGKKNEFAGSVFTSEINVADSLYSAMKKSKWKCFVLIHDAKDRIPEPLYGKDDYEEWKNL